MFIYIKRHTENIVVISILALSAAAPVTAGLYANGVFA
jgi:hypothetical protein